MDRELDGRVAEAEGFELIGLVPAYRDPENGRWCVGYGDGDMQPACIRHCDCDIRNDLILEGYEDDPWLAQSYKGHMLCCFDVVPFYSTDISIAWMLDGTNWKWRFEEYAYPIDEEDRFEMRLDVTLWIDTDCYTETLRFEDFSSKAEAYATARCLIFLEVKEKNDGTLLLQDL